MKPIVLLSSILISLACVPVAGQGRLTEWTLHQADSPQQYNVTVPCTVAGALNQAGVFGDDLFLEDRYKQVDKSCFDKPWVFTTRFAAPRGKSVILRFNGLNYRADIELNGRRIASADTTCGTFAVREFDVTSLAKRRNTLQVTVYRAQPRELNHGYVDWNPRALDESMGITGPVELIVTPDVQIEDVFVRPLVKPEDLSSASILVSCLVSNRSSRAVEGSLRGTYEGGVFTLPVKLAPGERRTLTVEETVKDPRIWWTREMGSPELYHLDVAFVKGKTVSHSRSVRFGIRDIQGVVDENGHRVFILNGRPLLIKSAGWTDDMLMQDTAESMALQVALVADMGLNCIRFENIWGKDDTIYDLCDEQGILSMVGFSCQWEWEDYCGLPETKGFGCINDPASEDIAVRYFHDQIIRLRNHPSLIGWLTGSDRIPNPRLEERYLDIYNKLEYRPYVCSAKGLTSLAGPSGMKMEGPYEWVGPDYWWTDTKAGGAYGFNTETGPGLNIPQLENLRRTVGEKDLWPIGPNWAYHCTASSSHMNNTSFQEKVMAGVYGEATGLEDYMRKAHALDYDSERAMFEAFRGSRPRSTGIVQWMLNSAWPSLYWQLYDWWGVPTAGYYGTRNACRPVQLVFNYADGCVWVVNDAIPETTVEARLRVYDTQSRLVREESREVTSRAGEPQKVFGRIAGPCFVSLEIGGAYEASNFYAVPAGKNVVGKAEWWGTQTKEYADLRFVSDLPEARVGMSVEKTADGVAVTLENKSEVIAYQNILKALDASGNLIPGAFWSDNFFALCPGGRKTVKCVLPPGTAADIRFSSWNAKID